MKKSNIFLTILLIILTLALGGLCACGSTSSEETAISYAVVRFNDGYIGDYHKAEVKLGETVTLPDAPTRTGYTFKGWFFNAADSENAFDAVTVVTQNVTVFAKWEKDSSTSLVTLKFMNYTTKDAVYKVSKGSAFARPSDPVYDENQTCAFTEWFTDIERTIPYDFSAPLNGDVTLYAGWLKQAVNIVFSFNYINSPSPITIVARIGAEINLPDTPTRTNYSFDGWYTSSEGGTLFDFTKEFSDDIVVYAHWSRSQYTVNFNTNGATLASGTDTTYSVAKNGSAEAYGAAVKSAMTYVGHDFAGWYSVKIDPDSEAELPIASRIELTNINDDIICFAAWTLQVYNIDFNLNYAGASNTPTSQSVKFGKTAEQVANPTRAGYLFSGWFTDSGYNNSFTFDMKVASDLTLYAKWVEDSGSSAQVTVTYVYNIGAGDVTYATKKVNFNGTADSNAPDALTVSDYLFSGWYEDKAFTKVFNSARNLTEDITVYGKMLKKYTFEAEAVNLEGKTGQGTSTNSFEEQMIMDGSFIKGADVSNGYFIRELYYNGAYLDFDIQSSEEVFDAVLYLRVSSESYKFFTTKMLDGVEYNYLSDTEFKIIVNGDWDGDTPLSWLNYGGLYMPMANIMEREDLAQNKTPFENILIIKGLHLKEGRNVITLYVANNNNHGGTYHAEAPIIDCMYIYSSATLTMFDNGYYTRPNVNRG